MFHVLFLASVYLTGQIRRSATVHVFPEYYYAEGGKLKLTVNGSSLRGITLRVVPKIALTILFRGSEYEVFCNHTFDAIFPPREPSNRFILGQSKAETWNLEVRVKGIFIPILTNCEKVDLSYALQYSNPSNLLDVRDQPIPKFYFVAACLYPLVMLVWLANGLRHPKFRVDIHTLFALAALAKAVSSYFKGRYWIGRQSNDFLADSTRFETASIWVIAHSLLFLANTLGAIGWGTWRETLPPRDFLYCGVLAFMFFGGIAFAMEHFSALIIVVLLGTIGLASLLHAQLLYNALDQALHLMHALDENTYPVVHKKLRIQVQFFQYVFLYLLGSVFISLFVIIFNDCVFVKSVVFELDVLGLFLVDMYSFLLRNEYNGDPEAGERVETESVAVVEVTDDVMMLEEPQDTKTLCIVSTPRAPTI